MTHSWIKRLKLPWQTSTRIVLQNTTISGPFNATPHERAPYIQMTIPTTQTNATETKAVAVYCASSLGNSTAYQAAAISEYRAAVNTGTDC